MTETERVPTLSTPPRKRDASARGDAAPAAHERRTDAVTQATIRETAADAAPTDEAEILRDGYKRPFDLGVIAAAHVLLLPLWALLWALIPLAIRLSGRGPVFYTQERLGLHGRPFRLIKFRTMVPDAEALTGPVLASEGDARVTRVGRVLRRFRLDEMPQVINILRGEMSLVGPRPERPAIAERCSAETPGFMRRTRVRPGVAGLAQVLANYGVGPSERLRYDNLYIRNMNPWLDLNLLFRAVWVTLRSGERRPRRALGRHGAGLAPAAYRNGSTPHAANGASPHANGAMPHANGATSHAANGAVPHAPNGAGEAIPAPAAVRRRAP